MTCENELKRRFWTNKFEHGSRFNPALPIAALQTTDYPTCAQKRELSATMQKYSLLLATEYWFICHPTFKQARPRPTCAEFLLCFSEYVHTRDLKRRRRRQWKGLFGPDKMSNAGDFSWGWILKDFMWVQKEEGRFVVVCPRPP